MMTLEIADADKALSMKKASIRKEVDVADAQAVKAGEMELKVQNIRIADQEVERQKLELNAQIREQADALKLYNETGLSIEALKVLPEIAAAVSEPLARAGETTIISTGGGPGDGTGAARLTDDVIQVMTQLGPIMKQLSGVDLVVTLDRESDRRWCLGILARRGDLQGFQLDRALELVSSPSARRRIESAARG